MYSHIDPSEFKQQLGASVDQFGLIMKDFKRAFVSAKMYPDNEEYQQQFSNLTEQLKTVFSQQYTLSNNILREERNLSQELVSLSDYIDQEKDTNQELNNNVRTTTNKYKAAKEMMYNFNDNYKLRYIRNWGVVFSIVVVLHLIRNTLRDGGGTSMPQPLPS